MGCTFEYVKFFRFRTPAYVTGVNTIPRAIALIDFSMDDLIRESIFISQVIPRCFLYNDLLNMEFTEYNKILMIAKDIAEKRKNG